MFQLTSEIMLKSIAKEGTRSCRGNKDKLQVILRYGENSANVQKNKDELWSIKKAKDQDVIERFCDIKNATTLTLVDAR